MRIILEEVDGSVYQDVILNREEARGLLEGELIEADSILKSKRHYIGVRIGEEWRYPSSIQVDQE